MPGIADASLQGKRVLVPVDDSAEARRAAEKAIDLAGRLGVGVMLMTVVATPLLPRQLLDPAQLDQLTACFRQAGDAVLERLRPLAEAARVPVETKRAEGVPADEILAEAARGYLFVVMGARGVGLSGRSDPLLGSVSDRVLRQSPVPVLIAQGES
jgi:nucleotide-binding universal stress UspA family protein